MKNCQIHTVSINILLVAAWGNPVGYAGSKGGGNIFSASWLNFHYISLPLILISGGPVCDYALFKMADNQSTDCCRGKLKISRISVFSSGGIVSEYFSLHPWNIKLISK